MRPFWNPPGELGSSGGALTYAAGGGATTRLRRAPAAAGVAVAKGEACVGVVTTLLEDIEVVRCAVVETDLVAEAA
jgi:hypothetical protein